MKRLVAGAALGAFLVAMLVIALESATSGDGSSPARTTTAARTVTQATQPTTTRRPPKPAPVKLTGVGAYDPEGDRRENDDLAPLAVDGNPSTFWKTEHYLHTFRKTGVGLLLDAHGRRRFSRVLVGTDGSGASAQIELGDSPSGPFRAVSADRPLSGTTAFTLHKGAAGRYLVVWITALPEPSREAHVTEVRAFGR